MPEPKTSKTIKTIFGIVMPISSIDGCSESHWNDVMEIINESIEEAGFEPNLVSNADDVGVIQKRIIQNLYDNPIVVCDVSGKNPNVMFELGIRLAFDRPTIIIKDDKTSYSFDTSPIEHLEYPRDLRFNKIQEFKVKLTDKIIKTHDKSNSDPNFSTFLKHFGEFKVAKLDKKEVSQQEFILDEIKSLRTLILNTNKRITNSSQSELFGSTKGNKIDICCAGAPTEKLSDLMPTILDVPDVTGAEVYEREPGHNHIRVFISETGDREYLRMRIRELTRQLKIKHKLKRNIKVKDK
jgi:hypothetical protein